MKYIFVRLLLRHIGDFTITFTIARRVSIAIFENTSKSHYFLLRRIHFGVLIKYSTKQYINLFVIQGIMAECAGRPSNGGKQSKDKQKDALLNLSFSRAPFCLCLCDYSLEYRADTNSIIPLSRGKTAGKKNAFMRGAPSPALFPFNRSRRLRTQIIAYTVYILHFF